jgi:ATP-dependent helicase YprA (DUF1998 family)
VRDLLEKTARERFGWDQLRAGQLEAMTAVMEGRDTLVVMPTGAGKSAIFQVPASSRCTAQEFQRSRGESSERLVWSVWSGDLFVA